MDFIDDEEYELRSLHYRMTLYVGDQLCPRVEHKTKFLKEKKIKNPDDPFDDLYLRVMANWSLPPSRFLVNDLEEQKQIVEAYIAALPNTEYSVVHATIDADPLDNCIDDPLLPWLVKLWNVVLSLPSLKWLEYRADLNLVPLTGKTLAAINGNERLTHLGLTTYGCNEEEYRQIAGLLRTNRVLKVLRIFVNTTQRDWPRDDQHVIHIIDALKENSTLQILKIVVRLFERKFLSTATQTAFVKLLEMDNMTLQLINYHDFFHQEHYDALEPMKAIDSLTRLNKHGKKELLKNDKATRQDWVNLVTVTKDNVHGIYHLLSMNPSLCDIAPRTSFLTTRKRRLGQSNGKSPRRAARKW